ncbi:hypothetical protein ACFYXS_13555 [Streptomyces sp. NPDC002574]|uniref:hypothetical protein n=1 Tax=Streptomyces sp. NPDC002574 TaxID=3364652 RepID=UPI00367BB320
MDQMPAAMRHISDREKELSRGASIYHDTPVRHTMEFTWQQPDGAGHAVLAVMGCSGVIPIPMAGQDIAVHDRDVRVVSVHTTYTRTPDEGTPMLRTRVFIAPGA